VPSYFYSFILYRYFNLLFYLQFSLGLIPRPLGRFCLERPLIPRPLAAG
jgi:hypothetical protein